MKIFILTLLALIGGMIWSLHAFLNPRGPEPAHLLLLSVEDEVTELVGGWTVTNQVYSFGTEEDGVFFMFRKDGKREGGRL